MPVFQTQNDAIYSLDHLYISGLNISVASTTMLAIAPGQARDQNNIMDMPVGFQDLEGNIFPAPLNAPNLTNFQYNPYSPFNYALFNYSTYPYPLIPAPIYINSAINGAGGLDTGTIAASSNYVVWLIGDSRQILPVSAVLSLYSNAYPIVPQGYDSIRQLGFVTTSGASAFVAASILNASSAKAYYLNPAVSVLSGGAATTFAAVALGTPIPTTSAAFVQAILSVSFTPAAANDTVQIRPTGGGTGSTNLVTIVGQMALVPQQQYVVVMTGVSGAVPSIQYQVTSASDSVSISVLGYIISLS